MIKISKLVFEEMIRLAEEERPIEACGYLAGVEGEIRELIPMINIDHSPEHFSFDPAEQFQAVKKARAQSLRLVAVYHSHPVSPARMSDEDLRLANDPEMIYVIISLLEQRPVVRAFQVVAKVIVEIPIQIMESVNSEESRI